MTSRCSSWLFLSPAPELPYLQTYHTRTIHSSWQYSPTSTAQCCVGSGYLRIFSVISFPSPVCSANHLPPSPATGCQPMRTVRSSPEILASASGITLGLAPRPRECSRCSLPLSSPSRPLDRPSLLAACESLYGRVTLSHWQRRITYNSPPSLSRVDGCDGSCALPSDSAMLSLQL